METADRMGAYILRRLLLMIPTLIGIMTITFMVIQFAPGGPIDKVIAQLQGGGNSVSDRLTGGGEQFSENVLEQGIGNSDTESKYRGAIGLDPEFIKKLEKQYGFDKPPLERYFLMMWNYARFDFGESYFRKIKVIDLIKEKMPVSISLGLWTTLISYLISIPLGIRKAVSDGSRFDIWSSGVIVVAYAIPGFMFGVMLIIFFAGGSYFDWFPLRGLTSDNFEELSIFGKILDYFWHLALPLFAMILSAFATTTLLTKNSFMDEIGKQYVQTARAKGLTENGVLYGHIFRNAMLIVIAGFPAAFVSIFFTGSLLIEYIFTLDGLGRLGYEAVVGRDYPVVFGTLFIYSIIGLIVGLISDLMYTWIDPRIDFESREV